MNDSDQFEKALMARLTNHQNDKEFLRQTSSAIVALKKQGFQIDRVFTKGLPPVLDKVFIMGKPHPDFWKNFKDFSDFPTLRRFEIFPYGIVNPEGLNFKATFEH